jgi:hypothetical protein
MEKNSPIFPALKECTVPGGALHCIEAGIVLQFGEDSINIA